MRTRIVKCQFALLAVFLGFILIVSACGGDDGPEDLVIEQEAYELQFMLPEGWRDDRSTDVGLEVGGGFGFGSPDYEGLTYLRLHEGEGFAVLGSWEPVDDAAGILDAAFASDVSSPEPITVLGVDGTYATGLIDQGQGIGAVHVLINDDGEARQYGFVGVVADDWEKFEATFLAIVESVTRMEGDS